MNSKALPRKRYTTPKNATNGNGGTERRCSIMVNMDDELYQEILTTSQQYEMSMAHFMRKAVVYYMDRLLPPDKVRLTED